MKPPTPKELLMNQLDTWKRAKKRSLAAIAEGRITVETHAEHIRNLNKLIFEYRQAIRILNTYGDD